MTEATDTQCAQMAATVEAHEKLKPFVGTFKSTVKMWMGTGDHNVSTGVMENRMELGGRYLHQSYKGDEAAGPFPNFEGRGYWGFNTVTGKYEGFWIDTASTCMQTETGDVDATGKVWTMTGKTSNPQTCQTMKKKSVITLHDDNTHMMEMYFQGPDGNESKGMEIKYTRIK